MRIPCLAVFLLIFLYYVQNVYAQCVEFSASASCSQGGDGWTSTTAYCRVFTYVDSIILHTQISGFGSCNGGDVNSLPRYNNRLYVDTIFASGHTGQGNAENPDYGFFSVKGTSFQVGNFCSFSWYPDCRMPVDLNCTWRLCLANLDCEGEDAGNEVFCPKNPHCASTEEGAQALLASARQECLEIGGEGTVADMRINNVGGSDGFCVSGVCRDCNGTNMANAVKGACCEKGFAPRPINQWCGYPMTPAVGIVSGGNSNISICTDSPVNENTCEPIPSSSDSGSSSSVDDGNCDDADDAEDCICEFHGICNGSSGSGSSDSSDGNSSDSSGSSNSGGNSSDSDNSSGSGSDSSNSGGSSGSGGDDGNSSGSGGSSGDDGDDGGGSSDSGSSSGSGGDGGSSGSGPGPGGGNSSGSSDGGISCEDLKNCDWSTLEKQLVQLDVEKEIRDSLKNLLQWLKYKSREDSLISLMRWSTENEDRKKMIEISETLNGRIFTYQAEQNRQFQKMDSLNGLYYSASLSASSANKRSLDSLRSELGRLIGDGSDAIVDAINGLSMSGVEDGLDKVSSKIDKSNSLLGRLDSTFSAGNGRLLAALDSLSGPCSGIQCGDYDGVDDGAFSGLDTSGFSRARWDSLLSVPGSGGIQDSAVAWSNRLRSATATPFVDGMACPAADLSVNFCEWFGGRQCIFSLCDQMFYIKGRHFFEWIGVFAEFTAWVLFLVRVA